MSDNQSKISSSLGGDLDMSGLVSQAKFIHLRTHSAYSLLEGALRVKTLTESCLKMDMPAIAVTDRNNLFGVLDIANSLVSVGVQPIIGVTLSVIDDKEKKDTHLEHILPSMPSLALFAKNQQGYDNLMALVSKAYLEGGENQSIGVSIKDIELHHEGVICLTGGQEGPIDHLLFQDNKKDAELYFQRLINIFNDNLYVEVQRYMRLEYNKVESQLCQFAYKYKIPLVASNQAFFLSEKDYKAHDALVCIAQGRYVVEEERKKLTPHHRLKTPEEMQALFSDLPEAIENTVEIARRCTFYPKGHKPILPEFANDDEETLLISLTKKGLKKRLENLGADCVVADYEARLQYELDIITKMGFCGYFLIVADFIQWAKEQGIAVGPWGGVLEQGLLLLGR